jgi:hypothetical protein
MKKITAKSTKSVKAAAASMGGLAASPVRPAPAKLPPAKKPAAKTTSTKITAHIDVGFGNTLYIRGEGPGLSWDRGLAMDCVADDEWTITISDATVPVTFKFLLNDLTWCAGNDYTVEPGGGAEVEPAF